MIETLVFVVVKSSVSEPDCFYTDPDHAFHFDMDPDQTFSFDTDRLFDTDSGPDTYCFKEVMYVKVMYGTWYIVFILI
jgi:hypothetical protein